MHRTFTVIRRKGWNWYLPKGNEIFVDLDSGRKWRCYVRAQALPGFGAIDLLPSATVGHYHVRVLLSRTIGEAERIALALHLGTDSVGAQHAVMRLARCLQPITLLVTPGKFPREPDDHCDCEHKHDTLTAMLACPVGRILRPHSVSSWYGSTAWDSTPWE
jgi:hypothetical protein